MKVLLLLQELPKTFGQSFSVEGRGECVGALSVPIIKTLGHVICKLQPHPQHALLLFMR